MAEKASYFNERGRPAPGPSPVRGRGESAAGGRGEGSHAEMMDKLVGYAKIKEISARATIKEGYSA